jgi:VanZ family protein
LPDPQSLLPPTPGRRFTWWMVAWLGLWAGLFVVMHTPIPRGMHLPFNNSDLIIHFGAYFTLALLGARVALARRVPLTPRWLLKWCLIYLVYCAADELLQGVPGVNRTPSLWDWMADAAGAIAALGMVYVNRPSEADADVE